MPTLAPQNKNNMPRKSSTTMMGMKNQINTIKNEINPVPRAGKASLTPKPMRKTTEIWIHRKARFVKAIAAATTETVITTGDIALALGLTSTNSDLDVRVDSVSIWNVTNSSASSNYVSVLPATNVSLSQDVEKVFEDYGAGGIPASVSVNIPFSLSNVINCPVGGTVTVLTLGSSPFPSTDNLRQTVVCDLVVRVKY
jgi:hypothetical protein